MNTLEKLFGTDLTKENEGVWVDYDENVRFRVAALGNKAAVKLGQQLVQVYRRADGEIRVPEDKQEDILLEVKSKTILLEWDGIKDAEGLPVPYTPEAGKRMLKELPHFARFIDRCAGNVDLYKRQAEEKSVKN